MVEFKLNKKAIKISSLGENNEKEFWRLKSPKERLQAIEINRKIVCGYGNTTPRFQKIIEVVELQKELVFAHRRLRSRLLWLYARDCGYVRHQDINNLEKL